MSDKCLEIVGRVVDVVAVLTVDPPADERARLGRPQAVLHLIVAADLAEVREVHRVAVADGPAAGRALQGLPLHLEARHLGRGLRGGVRPLKEDPPRAGGEGLYRVAPRVPLVQVHIDRHAGHVEREEEAKEEEVPAVPEEFLDELLIIDLTTGSEPQ